MYYTLADTIKSFYLSSGKTTVNVITNSDYVPTPVKLKRGYSNIELMEATNFAIGHRLHFDSESNRYIRFIVKDTVDDSNRYLRLKFYEVLNENFEVISKGELEKNEWFVSLSSGVYKVNYEKEKRILKYEKFDGAKSYN